jgi:hypothetical protein
MRPVLRPGDGGDHVKNLQRGLNKLGEILLVDGQFGPVTQEAVAAARSALALPGPPVADARLSDALAELPDPFPSCTASGVTFIAREEVISAANYRRHRQAPTWPQPGYGITIGIGYSLLCAATPEVFTSDWGGQLPPATIDRLVPLVGKVGSARLLETVKDLVVPFDVAMHVFATRSLPRSFSATRSAYPQVDALTAARRTALVSLVHTRGSSLPQTLDHLEMRTIRTLLASGYEDAVASQFDAMTRLWDPFTRPGPVRRRQAEAMLWRSGFPALQLD